MAGVSPIKGPAAKLVANMTESLTVPTATTFRELPVAVLEERRRGLNAALQAAGRAEKISFTHLIAYAIVQATSRCRSWATPWPWSRASPIGFNRRVSRSGWRSTCSGRMGAAAWWSRSSSAPTRWISPPFTRPTKALVEKARTNKLMPDDFAGATMSLTNPGGLGTVASVPRLMAGQGSIIAVGAIGYPAEFAGLANERVVELGISKIMTVTSTYDHRIIQGAESGAFLGTVDRLLQGEEGFYELIAESLELSAVSYQIAKASSGPKPAQEPVAPR